MSKAITMIFLILTISCGMKVDIPETNQNIAFGPDFASAAAFCDNRYYDDEVAAENCFMDYRDYLDITVGLDLSEIVDYCETNYTDPVDVAVCEDQLLLLLGGGV